MRRTLALAIACLSLALLGDCSRKPKAPQPATASGLATAPDDTRENGQELTASVLCPVLPQKTAIEKTIKDALGQIYGPDEAGVKVVVSKLVPDAGCKTVTVSYTASGSAATVPMTGDGETWSIMLYNKQYPVR